MYNLFFRAIIHPVSYSGVLKVRELIFEEKIEETPGVFSFIFSMPKPFSWQAGQHAIFTLPDKDVQGKTWRAFSIASSPHEGVIRIGTSFPKEPSDFKKKLMDLNPGEQIKIRGPFGEFHASGETQKIVGIAGGIGITPFRSLAYEISHGHLPETDLTLIFSAQENHPYKSDLDNWTSLTERLRIIYTNTPEEVNQALEAQRDIYGNEADYYISGSPNMIKALRKKCKQIEIKKIVSDPFKGY